MQLSPETVLAGHPAVSIRAVFRRWSTISAVEVIADSLGVTVPEAQTVLHALLAEGFVEEVPRRRPFTANTFELTVKGAALAQASAAKPLLRSTVEVKLAELIDRMTQVNADDTFLYGVEEAFVYGSYLSAKDRLGDLDISLRLYRKETDGDRYMEAAKRSARASGRHFGSYLDELGWPETQVMLFLKQRSRVYSIHVQEPLLDDPSIPRKAIFLKRRAVPPTPSRKASAKLRRSATPAISKEG